MNEAFEKLAKIRTELPDRPEPERREDEFLSAADLVPVRRQVAQNRLKTALAEIEELLRENRWQEIVELFFPASEKLPEVADAGLDVPVREKAAFALGQLGRYDDAIAELSACVEQEPENFYLHSALAYNAYNALFAAKNREILLGGKQRTQRIALAHRHFKSAQTLRPDGVTNFYREGMLFHKIEGKPEPALPLFSRAVKNWDALSEAEKERRHQERKNFIKALFQEAGTLLLAGRYDAAAASLKRCLAEDETSQHLSMLHKYFALGKVEFFGNRFKEARDALLFAEKCRKSKEPVDFVYELLARVYLAMGDPERALEAVAKVPEKFRRPYFRWTEADVFCAMEQYERAKQVLSASGERDRRSRHKSLLKIAKIEYHLGRFEAGARAAAEADRFFREKWGNAYGHGLFWQALNLCRAGDRPKASALARKLTDHFPRYPKLDRLLALIDGQDTAGLQ